MKNTAKLWENGPIEFNGQLNIDGDAKDKAMICRCGLSKNKPYCDGSHRAANFEASGEVESEEQMPVETADDIVLTITSRDNGPLICSGPLEITTQSGAHIAYGEKQVICRCGVSKNKPFCDGTHRATDFKTD